MPSKKANLSGVNTMKVPKTMVKTYGVSVGKLTPATGPSLSRGTRRGSRRGRKSY